MSNFIILNKPHYSTNIQRELIQLSDDELAEELFYSTDWFTDELFEARTDLSMSIGAEYSRLMVDYEKINNIKEPGNAIGRGVLYTHNYQGKLMRLIDDKSNKFLASYEKRLKFFNEQISLAESFFDEVIIIDCHSFDTHYTNVVNNTPGMKHPDICIGYNEKNCNLLKIQELKEHFKSLGYSVNLNFPFSGSYLPEYNIENPNVFTVMIEVNKDLYMSKDGFVPLKKDSFNKLKEDITNGIMIFA